MGKRAKAVLVFLRVIRASLIVGGSYREGVLITAAKLEPYYNSAGGSWGLQRGTQSYKYVVFPMAAAAVVYPEKSHG